MKIILSKNKKKIELYFGYDKRIVEQVKSIPTSKWDGDKWTIHINTLQYFLDLFGCDIPENILTEYKNHLIYHPHDMSHSVVRGVITSPTAGFNSKYLTAITKIKVISDWEKYRNFKAKRTKAILNEINMEYVVINLEKLFIDDQAIKGFTALRAINHPVAIDKGWYEQRYCDPKNTQYGRDVSGFSNKQELIDRIFRYVLDPAILI